GVFRASPRGGPPEQLASLSDGEFAYSPQMLPGGRAVLFSVSSGYSPVVTDDMKVVVQSLATKERTVVLERAGGGARFVSTGHLVYAGGGTLLAVAFDAQRLKVTGTPTPVVEGVLRGAPGGSRAAQFDVSDSGTLIYIPGPAGSLASASRRLV